MLLLLLSLLLHLLLLLRLLLLLLLHVNDDAAARDESAAEAVADAATAVGDAYDVVAATASGEALQRLPLQLQLHKGFRSTQLPAPCNERVSRDESFPRNT